MFNNTDFDNKQLNDLIDIEKKIESNQEKNTLKEKELFSNFSKNILQHKCEAVLGIDIYKYSEYKILKQNLIPLVFNLLLNETIDSIINSNDLSLFKNDIEMLKTRFISTGDGGFIFFNTPFHALIFNLHFHSVLHMYITGNFYPNLSRYVGNITIRSAITFNDVYMYGNTSYGKAIIENSRILHKDRLNRFIIDKKTYNYFNKYFNGIETLSIMSTELIKEKTGIDVTEMSFFRNDNDKKNKNEFSDFPIIRNIHIQKIEDLFSKNTKLQIYNIEIQYSAKWYNSKNPILQELFLLTIGNLNINNIN